MKAEITEVIADLVRRSNPEFDSRLEAQAKTLEEIECINPLLGQWIDTNDVKYLLSVFALKGEDFAAKFPAMAHIPEQDRQQVIAALETHMELCPHCSLKREYDLELDDQIKQVCQENDALLLQLLDEESEESLENDARARLKMERALSANPKI